MGFESLPAELVLKIAESLTYRYPHPSGCTNLENLSKASPRFGAILAPILWKSIEISDTKLLHTDFVEWREKRKNCIYLWEEDPQEKQPTPRDFYVLPPSKLVWVTRFRVKNTDLLRCDRYYLGSFGLVNPRFLPSLQVVEVLDPPTRQNVNWKRLTTGLRAYDNPPRMYLSSRHTIHDVMQLKRNELLEFLSGLAIIPEFNYDFQTIMNDAIVDFRFKEMPRLKELAIIGRDKGVLKTLEGTQVKTLHLCKCSYYPNLEFVPATLEELTCSAQLFCSPMRQVLNRWAGAATLTDLTMAMSVINVRDQLPKLPFRNLRRFALRVTEEYPGLFYPHPQDPLVEQLINIFQDNKKLHTIKLEGLSYELLPDIFAHLPDGLSELSIFDVYSLFCDFCEIFTQNCSDATLSNLAYVYIRCTRISWAGPNRTSADQPRPFSVFIPYQLLRRKSLSVHMTLKLMLGHCSGEIYANIEESCAAYGMCDYMDERFWEGDHLMRNHHRAKSYDPCVMIDFAKLLDDGTHQRLSRA